MRTGGDRLIWRDHVPRPGLLARTEAEEEPWVRRTVIPRSEGGRLGDVSRGWSAGTTSLCAIRAILRLAPRLIPIPLESYLKTHFTKVGDQTRLGMRSYIDLGKREGIDVSAIGQLTNFLHA